MAKQREGTDEIERCPECNSGHLVRDYERGELTCEECGLVIDDQFIDMHHHQVFLDGLGGSSP